MKTKGYIACICIFACLISLVACTPNAKNTVIEVGGYDYQSNADHSADIELFTQNRKVKLEKNKQVTVNEQAYNLEYDYTASWYLFHSEVDYYSRWDDGIFVQVGINNQTGAIDSFSWSDSNYLTSVHQVEHSQEECVNIARGYLNTYIDDIDAYELVDSNYLKIPEYEAIYQFEFVRTIAGTETCDRAHVGVTIYGTVISHTFISLGEMANATIPSNADMEVMRNDVDNKIKYIYASVEQEYTCQFEYDDVTFVKLKDGSYAMEFIITVTLTPVNGGGRTITEVTHLLAYV